LIQLLTVNKTQVGQLVGRLTNNEGKLPGQPKGPESAKAIQTRSGKETEDPECSTGARKPKPSAEAEELTKEEVTEIVTEEPEFEMPGEDMKIPQLKPCYFRGGTKGKEGVEEEERAEEEGREESQRSCCIRQDKGRKVACEDQKDD
jgi:hypothetical protein